MLFDKDFQFVSAVWICIRAVHQEVVEKIGVFGTKVFIAFLKKLELIQIEY